MNLRTLLYRAAGSGDPADVEKVVSALADSPENADRLAAAACTSDAAVLAMLAGDSCGDVRDAVARNPSASFQLVSMILQAGSAGYGSVMRKDLTEQQARALWLLVRGKFKSGTAVAYPEGLLGRPAFTRDVLGAVPYEHLPLLVSKLAGTDVESAARDAVAFRMHAHVVSARETPLMRLAPRRVAWLIAACAAARLGPDCTPKGGLAGSEELAWWADPFPFTADPETVESSYRRFDSMLTAAGRFLSGSHIDAVIASQEVPLWGLLYVSGSDSAPVRWMIDTFPSGAFPAAGFSPKVVTGMSDDVLADVAALAFEQRRVSLEKPGRERTTLEMVGKAGGQSLLDELRDRPAALARIVRVGSPATAAAVLRDPACPVGVALVASPGLAFPSFHDPAGLLSELGSLLDVRGWVTFRALESEWGGSVGDLAAVAAGLS